MVYDDNHTCPPALFRKGVTHDDCQVRSEELQQEKDEAARLEDNSKVIDESVSPLSIPFDNESWNQRIQNNPSFDNKLDSNLTLPKIDTFNQITEKTDLQDIKTHSSQMDIHNSRVTNSSVNNTSDRLSKEFDHNPDNRVTNICRDHDYFSTESRGEQEGKNEKPREANSYTFVKTRSENRTEQFQKNLGYSGLPSISNNSLETSLSSHDLSPKPTLVRLKKNGSVFKLPLAYLRNAVILHPYRISKAGESLLRPQLLKTPEFLTKSTISVVSKATQSSSKMDISADKISREEKHAKIRSSLDTLIETISNSTWNSVRDCVRVLARRFKLIDTRAEDPLFRSVHPFSSPSQEAFHSWSVAKRRSAEWTRAKFIRLTLEQCKFVNGESIWSTKMIMTWCRRQGYSSISCWSQVSSSSNHISCSLSKLIPQELSTISKIEIGGSQAILEDDVNVEIECSAESVDQPSYTTQVQNATFLLNDPEPDLTLWIADSIEKHGFKLGAELYDNFLVSLSRVLLSYVWRSMADDLLRRSLREAWLRTRGTVPEEISWIDTYRGITRRPQFDILTNAGLGVSDNPIEEQNLTTKSI